MAEVKIPVRVGVGVMLVKGGKVLLGKRHPDPEKASSELHGEGTWTLPGGKMDFGDTLFGAAAREVLEETGIQLKKSDIISVTNERVPDKHFVTIGFIGREFQGEPKVMEPDEITEWKWFGFGELPRPIFFPSEKIIKNYLDKVIYKH